MSAPAMTEHHHPDVERWIRSDGSAAVGVRRSLISWLEEQTGGEDEQLAAIIALIDLTKHCARSHPRHGEDLAELLYRAADEVATGDESEAER